MSQIFPHFHIVLLCDDFGAKLWPLANKNAPVCLTSLGASEDKTLLDLAMKRSLPFTDNPVQVVTTLPLEEAVFDELVCQDYEDEKDFNMLVVPDGQSSSFCIAMAAAYIRRKDPQAVIAFFLGGQYVDGDDRWARLLYRTYQLAQQDKLVVVGGNQKEKCATYSYIRKGKAIKGVDDAYEVGVFVPDVHPNTARRMCNQGALWYTGILVGRPARILGELTHASELEQQKPGGIANHTAETAQFMAQLEPQYWLKEDARELLSALPNTSYEKAVLENCQNLIVVLSTLHFTYFSNICDLEALTDPDEDKNYIVGEGHISNSRNTLLCNRGQKSKILIDGVQDLLVVDTEEGLLITTHDRAHRFNLPSDF